MDHPYIDWVGWGLIGRLALVNIVPFVLVFQLVMRRRRQSAGETFSELKLIAAEVKIVGLLGYYVILSIYFFSIPVLQYLNTKPGYSILLIQPDEFTVFIIAFISFTLVVAGIYLQEKRIWAYRLLLVMMTGLVGYAFFTILEFGFVSIVPVVLFSYLLFRLKRESLYNELRKTS